VPHVAVLTGGGDRPYALGLVASLVARGLVVDLVGSDDLRAPEVCENERVRFLNLRGDQRPDASAWTKVRRLVLYYLRLIRYSWASEAPLFHILWNNKLEWFDRTLLQLYYRACGRRLVMTLHNVNREARDGTDTRLNRWTLRVQYRLSDHLFVHTRRMQAELERDYGVPGDKVTVIPFGINSTVPDTALTGTEARRRLGLSASDKIVLFFGNIAPYKGLQYLIDAMPRLAETLPECRLVIAGRPKPESHWRDLKQRIDALRLGARVLARIEYVPDAETEIYFKAADVLALPYVHVFQSGVLSLAYNFGLPVIAADVGSLKEDVAEAVTGFVCPPSDAAALVAALQRYFAHELYRDLSNRRGQIQRLGRELYSWDIVARLTSESYLRLLRGDAPL
jgi:glycosyltransferase involved in cell wall biosynthesis